MIYMEMIKVLGNLSDEDVRNLEIAFLVVPAVIALISAVGFGIACRAIVKGKGYPPEMNRGFLWGFFLGLIGLIVCAVKPVYGQMNQFYYNGQPMNGGQYGQPYGSQQFGDQYSQPYGQNFSGQDGWYCSCGAQNTEGSNFCRICGMKKR